MIRDLQQIVPERQPYPVPLIKPFDVQAERRRQLEARLKIVRWTDAASRAADLHMPLKKRGLDLTPESEVEAYEAAAIWAKHLVVALSQVELFAHDLPFVDDQVLAILEALRDTPAPHSRVDLYTEVARKKRAEFEALKGEAA